MRYAMVCLYIYILYMMWFLPAIACMQTEKSTSRSHHTSGNLQISTIRSQILTYGNDVMKSAAGSFLDLGIRSGKLSSMYRFELTFWIPKYLVLLFWRTSMLCDCARSRPPREAQYPISRSAPGQQWWQIGGIAAFARKIPSLCCSVPCLQSTMRHSALFAPQKNTHSHPQWQRQSQGWKQPEKKCAATATWSSPMPGHRLDNPIKLAPWVEHGICNDMHMAHLSS